MAGLVCMYVCIYVCMYVCMHALLRNLDFILKAMKSP